MYNFWVLVVYVYSMGRCNARYQSVRVEWAYEIVVNTYLDREGHMQLVLCDCMPCYRLRLLNAFETSNV